MKNLIALSLICFILNSCSESEKESNNFYVIKEPKMNELSIHKTFYGQHNFIIIDSNKLYYHNKYVNYSCGTGIDFSKPPKLYLYPDTLKEIKLRQLKYFLSTLKFNPTNFSDYSFASISSSTDTIKNKVFPILIDFFKAKTNLKFTIRKWTEEEEVVSIAKKENKPYSPYIIEWKIGFDHKIPQPPNVIEFLPPKVEKLKIMKFILKIILLFIALNTNAQTIQNDTLFKVCNDEIDSLFKYYPSCGFINHKGDTIIPLGKYAQCWEDYFVGNFTIVCLKDPELKSLATAIDRNGKVLFDVYVFGGDVTIDWVEDGMIRIVKDNKIGYANSKGEIMIKPQFSCASQFENGKAKVTFDCKDESYDLEHKREISDSWFYIDKKGNVLKL